MTPDVYRSLARYNRWMNAKVYTTAARLDDVERKRDAGAFFGSIHRTLNHILVADRIWMGRMSGQTPEPGCIGPGGIVAIDQELHADFEALRRERDLTDGTIAAWAQTTTAEALAAPLRFVRKGEPYEIPLWWAATQLFNHQTHHRGQITTLLSQAGHDPGATDHFAMMLEERAAG